MKAFALLILSLFAASAHAAPMTAPQRAAEMAATLQAYYPARARAAGEQGTVGFSVLIDRAGEAKACNVTRSSGFSLLDEETCAMIVRHAEFKQEVDDRGHPKTARHQGVIVWRLPEGAGVAAATPPATPASLPQPILCRRALKGGSIVVSERTCMTPRDWAVFNAETKRFWAN